MSNYQLAQINIAHAIDNLDSNTLAGFVSRLDEINLLAESSPGYVWRVVPGEDPGYKPGYTDPRMIVNLSVWESIESLKAFVYQSTHLELIQQKSDWFDAMNMAHLALWWVPAGTQPTEQDGIERLNYLRENGPSEYAFSIAQPHPMPS